MAILKPTNKSPYTSNDELVIKNYLTQFPKNKAKAFELAGNELMRKPNAVSGHYYQVMVKEKGAKIPKKVVTKAVGKGTKKNITVKDQLRKVIKSIPDVNGVAPQTKFSIGSETLKFLVKRLTMEQRLELIKDLLEDC